MDLCTDYLIRGSVFPGDPHIVSAAAVWIHSGIRCVEYLFTLRVFPMDCGEDTAPFLYKYLGAS